LATNASRFLTHAPGARDEFLDVAKAAFGVVVLRLPMDRIAVVIGSKENVIEDISLLARKWLENPKIVAVTGADIRSAVVEKSSALFIDGNLVLALLDPEPKALQEVKDQFLTLKEIIHIIVYYTDSKSDVPAFLGKAPVQLEQDRDTRIRNRVLSLTRARGKKMTDKAFAVLKERTKDESLLEHELTKVLDYVGDKETIELRDVAAVVTQTHEDTLITLFDAMAQKNHKQLIGILDNLLSQGLHILAIQNFLVRQVRLLLQAKDMEDLLTTEMSYKMFSKTFTTLKEGLDFAPHERKHYFPYQKPYYAFNLSKTSMKFSKKELVSLLGVLAGLDTLIKTGTKYDKVRLETALLEV
jgi:DNA polymerase III delta subunit